eukprot:6981685-Pyramimonas_sp.AAC.1
MYGLDDYLITRLLKKGIALSERQAKDIEQLRVSVMARGPQIRINLQDLSSREASQKWTWMLKSECQNRPESSRGIHDGS